MEATTIDQLCSDVLEEIFSHLSGSDLKNCALACKDWNETIGTSTVAMKKFRIIFRLDRDHISYGGEHNREKILQSTNESYRKYQEMEILIHDGSLTQLPSLDRFNLSQVKSLNLHFTSFVSIELSKVMELLSRMSLLQALEMRLSCYCTITTSNALAARFTKLKQLNFKGAIRQPIISTFDSIKANNITELTYCTDCDSDEEIDVAVDFVKGKKSLAKLTFSAEAFTQLLRRHDFSGMNLESLIVTNDGLNIDNSDIVIENIRKSLISNSHSLTSLSIPSRLISKKVLLVIFNRLRKLTSLEIDGVYDHGGGDSWMTDLSSNDFSHDLPLKNLRVGAIDGFEVILQRAPQLKKVRLGHIVTVDILRKVVTSCQGLVELRIFSLKGNLTSDKRFVELKSLTVDGIRNLDCLESLLEWCPKIEAFACPFYRTDDTSSITTIIGLLLEQKNLKHLQFSTCVSAVRRIIFDMLKTNYGNLRSMKFRSAYYKIIYFDFPENPADWNVEEQESRFSDFQVANPT